MFAERLICKITFVGRIIAMEGHSVKQARLGHTLLSDSLRIATSGRSCKERGRDKDEHISSVAVGGAGLDHGAETPARG